MRKKWFYSLQKMVLKSLNEKFPPNKHLRVLLYQTISKDRLIEGYRIINGQEVKLIETHILKDIEQERIFIFELKLL